MRPTARSDLEAAATSGDEEAENETMERELRSSLQAVSATVPGLDGHYGLIQPHVEIDVNERAARRKNRTGRATWVSRQVQPLLTRDSDEPTQAIGAP